MKKRKILFGVLGFITFGFISFTALSLFANEPVIVKGETLNYSNPSPSICTNIYKNGFYTHEITLKLNIFSNNGAAYLVPYNAPQDDNYRVTYDSGKINGSTRIIFDGQMYNQTDEIKVSETGVHRVKICDGYNENGTFLIPKNAEVKEDFYFYVETSSSKKDYGGIYDFYYAKYSSANAMILDILSTFDSYQDSFSISASKILNVPMREILATSKTSAGLPGTTTDLYTTIIQKWDYFSKNNTTTDRNKFANDLYASAELDNPINAENKVKIRLLSVEDDEASGDISITLKEKAAFFFDPAGTDIPANNTSFKYDSSIVNKHIKDMFYGWETNQVDLGYRYNILDSVTFSCSGNRWFTNKNGDYVDLNNFTQLELSFSTENPSDYESRTISSTLDFEYLGTITISSNVNLIKKEGYQGIASLDNIPMFIAKRARLYNVITPKIEPPQTNSFSQMVKVTTESDANTEILNYVYNSSNKYVIVSYGAQNYRDYSCFPWYSSVNSLNNNLNSTRPGIYSATFEAETFYRTVCSATTEIVIRDENAPKIISKYDVLYMPISYKETFNSHWTEYFKAFDDVDKFNVSCEKEFVSGWNDDSETAVIRFVVKDSSDNVTTKEFIINFYDSSKLNFWEEKINPGLYAYKKWFLGIFGLKA